MPRVHVVASCRWIRNAGPMPLSFPHFFASVSTSDACAASLHVPLFKRWLREKKCIDPDSRCSEILLFSIKDLFQLKHSITMQFWKWSHVKWNKRMQVFSNVCKYLIINKKGAGFSNQPIWSIFESNQLNEKSVLKWNQISRTLSRSGTELSEGGGFHHHH